MFAFDAAVLKKEINLSNRHIDLVTQLDMFEGT
jgi:hypothetical protein